MRRTTEDLFFGWLDDERGGLFSDKKDVGSVEEAGVLFPPLFLLASITVSYDPGKVAIFESDRESSGNILIE